MKYLIILAALLGCFTFVAVRAQEQDGGSEVRIMRAEAIEIVASPAADEAQEASSGIDLASVLSKGKEAYKSKNWPIAISFGIMFFFGLMNRLPWTPTIPSQWMPATNFIVGLLLSGATNLIAGMPWMDAILLGLSAGAGASGIYSIGGKKLFKVKGSTQ